MLWATHITIGDTWKIVGFAPDQTVYLWDDEAGTICGIRHGIEEWAVRAADTWFYQGITSDGRVWLTGSGGVCCLNSKGEGGWIAALKAVPRNVLKESVSSSKSSGICRGGAVQLSGIREPIPVDGNCNWMVGDDTGRFYAGTDRGTVYCFSSAGTVLWKLDAGTSGSSKPLFSLGDMIIAGEDRLFCVREGAVRWALQLGRCRPALVDKVGTIYLSYSEDGRRNVIAAVDRDGHVIWRLQSALEYEGVTLDPEGRLYLVDRGSLLCVGA